MFDVLLQPKLGLPPWVRTSPNGIKYHLPGADVRASEAIQGNQLYILDTRIAYGTEPVVLEPGITIILDQTWFENGWCLALFSVFRYDNVPLVVFREEEGGREKRVQCVKE